MTGKPFSRMWFTSDHHFGHKNIVRGTSSWTDKSECRPFDTVEEHNQAIVDNWNSVVFPEDFVVCLGDFSFMKKEPSIGLVESLNGTMCIMRGNHDGTHRRMSALGFERVFSTPVWLHNGDFTSDTPDDVTGPGTFLLNHYPWGGGLSQDDYPPGTVLLHGHTHSTEKVGDHSVNLSLEAWDYFPAQLCSVMVAAKFARWYRD